MAKILYLGPPSSLEKWLKEQGEELTQTEDKISVKDCEGIDWIVSYGYRFILDKEVVEKMKGRAINLHISYLPWNRGADPNYWSWKENTPKGVTIHLIDEGVDSGAIIDRVLVPMGDETLASSYQKLKDAIESRFKRIWPLNGPIGSYHYVGDMPALEKGWDTPVEEL